MDHPEYKRHRILLLFVLSLLVITSGFILFLFHLSSNNLSLFPKYKIDSDIQGIVTVSASVPLDEDGDGMPNNWEDQYGLNPSDPSDAADDNDGDGLDNLQEYQHGTDPTNPDTDFGGTNDGDEVLNNCTDPLNPLDDGQFYCPICGDGNQVPSEECDDGNTANGDGCNSMCEVEYCGDGVVNNNGTEECDGSDGLGMHQSCSPGCELIDLTYCGDGIVQTPNDEGGYEQCEVPDIQNQSCVNGSGYSGVQSRDCQSSCLWGGYGNCNTSEYCSDNVLNGDEECDDGNLSNGDGCSNACTIEPVCGNGDLEPGETCDDGNTTNGDNCSSTCQNEKMCGDGELEYPEECDDGNNNNGDGCSSVCKYEVICGDSRKEGNEECDDGNQSNGDGCSNLCKREGGVNDSDNDGLPDWWEDRYDFPPGQDGPNDDPDQDGVPNIEEYKHKTNPMNPDTDGDKLKDGEEIYNFLTSPILKDTDRDGLNDYDEIYLYKTDPNKFDTDNGGIGDGDEIINKTNPLDPKDDAKISSELYVDGNSNIQVKDAEGIFRVLANLDYEYIVHVNGEVKEVILEYDSVRYVLLTTGESGVFHTVIHPENLGPHRGIIKIVYKSGSELQYSRYFYVLPNGRILNGHSGYPLNSAKVELYKFVDGKWVIYKYLGSILNNPQTTDEDGRYKYFVESGQYRLEIRKFGYRSYQSDIYLFEESGYINDDFFILPIISTSTLPTFAVQLLHIFEQFSWKLWLGIFFFFLFILLIIIYFLIFRRSKIIGYVYDLSTNTALVNIKLRLNNKEYLTNKKGYFDIRIYKLKGEFQIQLVTKEYKSVYNLGDSKNFGGKEYAEYTPGSLLIKDQLQKRIVIYVTKNEG